MGLDIVELVLAVEEDFEIRLVSDWSDIHTVGDLHMVICNQLDQQKLQPTGACLTIAPFFATRDSLLAMLPVTRHEVRPSSLLTELISGRQRRKVWPDLQARTSICPLGVCLRFAAG